jgi:hypothetical protein
MMAELRTCAVKHSFSTTEKNVLVSGCGVDEAKYARGRRYIRLPLPGAYGRVQCRRLAPALRLHDRTEQPRDQRKSSRRWRRKIAAWGGQQAASANPWQRRKSDVLGEPAAKHSNCVGFGLHPSLSKSAIAMKVGSEPQFV